MSRSSKNYPFNECPGTIALLVIIKYVRMKYLILLHHKLFFLIEMSRIFMPENNYVALPTELQSLSRVKMRLELMTHGLTRRSN